MNLRSNSDKGEDSEPEGDCAFTFTGVFEETSGESSASVSFPPSCDGLVVHTVESSSRSNPLDCNSCKTDRPSSKIASAFPVATLSFDKLCFDSNTRCENQGDGPGVVFAALDFFADTVLDTAP